MKHTIITALALAQAALLAGCVHPTPATDARMGLAVAVLRAEQTYDPRATARNALRSPDGMDARSGRETMVRYYKAYSEPPQTPNVLSINLGAGAEGGAR